MVLASAQFARAPPGDYWVLMKIQTSTLSISRMAFVFLLAAAAPVAAQQRANEISTWITNDDIPASAQRKSASVRVEYTVSPSGMVTDCKVAFVTGHRPFGKLTCSLIQQRARYVPAFSKKGEPVAARDILGVSWAPMPEGVSAADTDFGSAIPLSNPGLWVLDTDIPRKMVQSRPFDVAVTFAIGVDGRVRGCEASVPSESPEAGALICSLLRSRARFKPPVGRYGQSLETSGRTVVHFEKPR